MVRATVPAEQHDTRAPATPDPADPRLARRLVLDELFDLSLYRSLRDFAPPDLRRVLEVAGGACLLFPSLVYLFRIFERLPERGRSRDFAKKRGG